MNVFSLMVPSRNPAYKKKEYVWRPAIAPEYSFIPSGGSSVTVEFRSPRTPDDQMNTIQPFISELFSRSLREIVSSRLSESFLGRDIPVESFDVEYLGSASCAGDERFSVSVRTSRGQLMPASMAVAPSFVEVCSKGIGAGGISGRAQFRPEWFPKDADE